MIAAGGSSVRVAGECPPFEAKARDGKVVPKRGEAPPEVDSALRTVPASEGWKGVTMTGGLEGIEVSRRGHGDRWLADLWLAERVAAALG